MAAATGMQLVHSLTVSINGWHVVGTQPVIANLPPLLVQLAAGAASGLLRKLFVRPSGT